MDHFPVDSTRPGGACGAGSDFAEWFEGAVYGSNGSGPYATRQESQCRSGRVSKLPDSYMANENARFNSL